MSKSSKTNATGRNASTKRTRKPATAKVIPQADAVVAPVAAVDPVPVAAVAVVGTGTGAGLKIEKDRPEQNGIKRPSAGGKCRAIWDALDEYRTDEGVLPDAKFVRLLAAEHGYNPNNASIEFYQWRKFNGITGRQPKPVAPAEAS